jgi:hypothetical protein
MVHLRGTPGVALKPVWSRQILFEDCHRPANDELAPGFAGHDHDAIELRFFPKNPFGCSLRGIITGAVWRVNGRAAYAEGGAGEVQLQTLSEPRNALAL